VSPAARPCSWCPSPHATVQVGTERLCVWCAARPRYYPTSCPSCQVVRAVAFLIDGQRVCAGCAKVDPSPFACAECGREDHPYTVSRCARCFLRERLTNLLTDPTTGAVHVQLQPVFDALINAERPRSTMYWLRRGRGVGPRLLGQMARGEVAISHDTFANLPTDRAHNYLRDLLAALGVLPEYEPRIERMSPWLAQLLAPLPREQADLLGRFARWHVMRRMRRKADAGALTNTIVNNARWQILAAAQFLTWCHQHKISITTLDQAGLERYWTTHRSTPDSFVRWLTNTNTTTSITIPAARPPGAPQVTVSDAERWSHVELLLHDTTIRHYTRIAGLFMLLFAQPLAHVCRMRTDQVDLHADGTVFVTFERTPLQMPAPLDQIIREHLQRRGQASYASRDNGWLFPGGIPGRPLVTENVRAQLVERGIKPYDNRKAALLQLAAEVPTPLLADMLGIAENTAVRWGALAGRTWTGYIAQRTPTPAPGNNARPQ
jgi:hypothetical protein